MNQNNIDSVAAFSKLGIETSNLTRDNKERAKSGIDCVSALLKLLQTSPQSSTPVTGIDFEQISRIKKIAVQCSVEKVVLFPYPNGQSVIPLIRVYGGNKELFFKYNGWNPLQSGTNLESEAFDRLEDEFGIILYAND